MTWSLVGKSVLIAGLAALASWLYLLAFAHFAGGEIASSDHQIIMLYGSLLGSFAIGLPVALLVYWMSREHLLDSPSTLSMIALLAGVMMMLASFVLGGRQAIVMLGIPAFLAAITFGTLGWFWIIKPLRRTAHV